jgi:hypothetical protein
MSVNPYAPPTAYVADISTPDDAAIAPRFFAVSVTKLVVMSVCTFSGYEIYWFYRQWKRIAERERESMAPLARAIFAFFYCYSCFARIRDYDAETRTSTRLAAGPLAIGWIVTTVLWRLPDPYWWISMFTVLFLIPVQRHVNRLNIALSPLHDCNARFSIWNWLAIIFGGSLIMLALAGTFLPEVE